MESDPHQSSVDRPPVDSEAPQSASLELCMESPENESREEMEPTVAAPDNELDGNGQYEEHLQPTALNEIGDKEGKEDEDEKGEEEEANEEIPEEEKQMHDDWQDGETVQNENKQNEIDDGDEGAEELVKELEKDEEELEKGECAPSTYLKEDHSSEVQQYRSTVPEGDEGDERATDDSSLNSRPQHISDESRCQQYQLQNQEQNQELQDRMLLPQELRGSPYMHGIFPQGHPGHFPPGQFHPSNSPFNHPPGSLHFPPSYYQTPAYNHPSPSFYNQQPGSHQGGYQQGWPGYTGAPAFPVPQPISRATPPGSVRLIRPSSNSGSAFSSPTGKDEDESGPRSIKVRGFDSKMNDLPDVLESYFGSKRKSGGGAVDDVEIKKNAAIITFESAAIARRVLSKTDHTIKGKPFTVELYDPGVKKQNPAIKVTGLPPDMDDEVLETYFESKRKSEGGEVARMERRKGGRVAIITFEEMEVATRVASKSSHQIKGKPVTVELFDSDDDMPEQDPVIKVTGLPPNMEDDQVEMYFESKRKSEGGEVVEIERRKGGRIAIVTFKEMEVAQRVVSKKNHIIKDHPITVELYDPDDDTPVQDPVIKVTGLSPNMEDDTVEAFFGSKRKCGGGDIVKMERRKGGSIAIVTFKEMEDAKRVVEKGQHSIKNTKVDVCFWEEEEEEEEGGESSGADIEVRGFKPSTTDEVIQMYFENKSKSGGGAVKSLKRSKKKGVITITFDSPKVVERVVSKRDHTLEGKKLTVTAKKASHSDSASGDDSGDEEFQSAEEGDEAETSTVKVTGILEGTSEETFTLYFENERKSGGGDLKSCLYSSKEQALLVTFQSPKVAQRVAEKKDHRVAGQELTVRLYTPPPQYKDRVLFEGVPESVSHDALQLYLENVTSQDGLKVLYGDEPGTILVTCQCNVDFEAIQDKCQKKSLDGQHMTPQQVEITRSILVKPVTAEITKTILELHFDNKNRSGGEGVEEVEMMPDMEMAIIKFEDHKVAEQVAKRRQEVSQKVLQVSLHHECLGLSGGTEDPTHFKFPEPLEMKELDPFKTGCLHRLEKATADLQTTLSALEACLDPQVPQRGCLVVECSVPKDAKDGHHRTRNWTQKAHKAVEDFMETLAVIELNVSHDIQEDLTVGMTAMLQEYPCFTLVEHNTKLAVVGPRAEMAGIRESISAVTKEVQESHDRKKNLKEETMSVQTASKMDLLRMVGLPASVQEKYPKLEVSFRQDSQQVLLKGIDAEILAAKLAIMELLEAMTPVTMSQFSNYQVALMEEKKASAIVNACLRKERLRASWEVKEGQLLVLTLTPADRDPVQNLLKTIVLEGNIKLDDEQRVLVKSQDWKTEIQKLNQNFKGMWIIANDGEKGILIVAAIHEVFAEVKKQVEHFLDENAEYTTTFPAPGPRLKFLNLHNKVEGIKRTCQVEIRFQEKDSVQIKGKKGRISQAWQDVSNALSSIQVQTMRLKQFQIKKCLTKTQKGQQRVEELQKSTKCVIDMEASDGDVTGEMQGEVEEEDRESMATCTVPGTGVNIRVMGSNASQTSAEAILVVLGKEEEQELKTRVASFPKTRSLKESDVEWLPGAKGDKSLLITKGPESGSFVDPDTTIKDLIKKALETAKKHHVTSVAVPVETLILSGTGFSAMETCRAVVESMQAFVSTHKDHSISSIILCYLKQEIQDLLVESLEVKFGRQSVLKKESYVSEEASELPPFDTAGAAVSTGPRIFLEKKDIVKEEPDVMVNSTNTSLDLSQGQVSKALLSMGGQAMQDECKKKYPEGIKPGDIAVTPRIGALLCVHAIYHVVLEKWNSDTGEKTLHDYVVKILEKAAADNMTSVALPALGSGNLGYPRDVVARSMYNGVTQFGVDNPHTSVKDVYFVVHPDDKTTVKAFEQEDKKRNAKKSGVISQIKGALGMGTKPKQQVPKTPVPERRNPRRQTERASRADSSLAVAVYAEDKGTIEKVFGMLMSIAIGQVERCTVKERSLCDWEGAEIKKLTDLSKLGVDVTVQLHPGQVELRGLNDDIIAAQSKLHEIISKWNAAKQERATAENMANFIQWHFVEIGENGEKLEKYDDVMVNYGIEMAYRGQKDKYVLPGGDYYIDFDKLMEFSARDEDEEPVRVVRRDRVEEANHGTPNDWSDMGSEMVKPVALLDSSDEFKKVVRNFESTMKGPVQIVKIERVQNVELWNQYGAKRLQIAKHYPSGVEYERTLWHGTSADAVPSIIMRGFNRSYCGKNETALGQGVYFATKSIYSSRDKYSPRENNGHKHMFQARVLVGVPTKGDKEMRVLGPRDPAKPELLFDSAVDKVDGPEIFVIFNDTQAYPEYHIVFTV